MHSRLTTVFASVIQRICSALFSIAGRLGVTGAVVRVCSDISPIAGPTFFSFLHVHASGCPLISGYRAEFFFRNFHNVINVLDNIAHSTEVLQ
jgi:hypothetical protein